MRKEGSRTAKEQCSTKHRSDRCGQALGRLVSVLEPHADYAYLQSIVYDWQVGAEKRRERGNAHDT